MFNYLLNLFRSKKHIEADYLIFGRFYSDNYAAQYPIYKLDRMHLYVDDSSSWHHLRHGDGYTFKGTPLSDEKFQLARELLYACPASLLNNKDLKGFYTTGNKNEDKIILEISHSTIIRQITIDDYDIHTEKLPAEIKEFMRLIDHKLEQLRPKLSLP